LTFGSRYYFREDIAMVKKIMVIAGSPRREGNTNTVVKWFAESARQAGAEVEIVDAAHMEYKANGCTECMGCQQSEKFECVIPDEASEVIKRMPQFDAVILATPIFWFGPSAQLKLLLDRTFALAKFDPETGEPVKKNPADRTRVFGLIATAGGGLDSGLTVLDETYRSAADCMGYRYESLLVPFAPADPKAMSGKTEISHQAAELAKLVIGD
jgi:multimeric flavodoxin WrbA